MASTTPEATTADAAVGQDSLPGEFDTRTLIKRALQVVAILVVVVLVAALTPGLDQVRDKFADAKIGWLVIAVVFETLSCASYVLMFRPIFCRSMSRRTAWELSWSELGMGSILPASGAGGLALGAWVLHHGGMNNDRIARRTVAFFLIKGFVNFLGVVGFGVVMAVGLVGPHKSLWLTAFPAALAAGFIAVVLAVPRLGPGRAERPTDGKVRRGVLAARHALINGTAEAKEILARRDWRVLLGAFGYCFWDILMLYAAFKAFGSAPAVTVVFMGYLVGQLGGLLPIPGGIGGIDGGLIGALVVFGAPAAQTAAAVLAFRFILFWLPLVVGAFAFVSLRKGLNDPERDDLCRDDVDQTTQAVRAPAGSG